MRLGIPSGQTKTLGPVRVLGVAAFLASRGHLLRCRPSTMSYHRLRRGALQDLSC